MPSTDLLPTADLARIRQVAVDLGMPDTCQVERDTATSDNAGGSTSTTALGASTPCRLRVIGTQTAERVIADRLGWTVSYAVDLPLGTDVTPKDRLRIAGRLFEIGGVVTGGAWAVKLTVIVEERSA